MEVILKLFLITSWKHFNFAMHHWYKQFILQMLCRDKEADPCSLQSLRKCSGMWRGCHIFSTLFFPTLRSLKHIQSHFPRHRALTQFWRSWMASLAMKKSSSTATWPAEKTHLHTAHLLSKRKQKHQYKRAGFYFLFIVLPKYSISPYL